MHYDGTVTMFSHRTATSDAGGDLFKYNNYSDGESLSSF